ncbi:DUF739 family protein [Romboutsia ilealis]|uniref:DUF739 family protein n=1 Tax=Romboutsia faecis TaxID=2764597 RepID=A0ABR7JP27_9FIRM|nr:DUF739 family protein [Romboutsia faecis]MBC5996351.1 DUF739 family protein [Romboutsia faecis]MRN25009.1 DUF739 family protein [Romboutsia ilealis]
MSFDYKKLKGRIKEYYDTQDNFAKALNIGRTGLSLRLNNRMDFTQKEINRAYVLLDLSKEEIPEYFFKQKV